MRNRGMNRIVAAGLVALFAVAIGPLAYAADKTPMVQSDATKGLQAPAGSGDNVKVPGTFEVTGASTFTGNVDINGGAIDGVTIGAAAAPTVTDLGSVATCDINGGSIDGVTIGAAAAPTVTDLGSVATCDINGGAIDGAIIGAASAAAITGTTITGTTITDGTVSLNAGTVTGTFADLGTVTTVDVNGGSIDGVTIGAAAAPTVTDLGSVATCDINGGTIDSTAIGSTIPSTGVFTSIESYGAVSLNKGALVDSCLESTDCANISDNGTQGGISTLFVIDVDGGAAGDDDITLADKIRIVDVWCVHYGGAGEASDTIQVTDGSNNAITDAMDWSGADKTVVRAGEIDDANYVLASGTTLRVKTTDDDSGTDVGAGKVFILCAPSG